MITTGEGVCITYEASINSAIRVPPPPQIINNVLFCTGKAATKSAAKSAQFSGDLPLQIYLWILADLLLKFPAVIPHV